MTPTAETLLSLRETQKHLGNPARSTIYRWINDGLIPAPIRIGGRVFWRSSDLAAFIQTLPANAGGPENE